MGAAGLIIIGVILFGMIAGGIAQLILGVKRCRRWTGRWPSSRGSSVRSSAVCWYGLITQHRFVIEPSGLIFSVIGAIIDRPVDPGSKGPRVALTRGRGDGPAHRRYAR